MIVLSVAVILSNVGCYYCSNKKDEEEDSHDWYDHLLAYVNFIPEFIPFFPVKLPQSCSIKLCLSVLLSYPYSQLEDDPTLNYTDDNFGNWLLICNDKAKLVEIFSANDKQEDPHSYDEKGIDVEC